MALSTALLSGIYNRVAAFLTYLENPRTAEQRDRSLSSKLFLFSFAIK